MTPALAECVQSEGATVTSPGWHLPRCRCQRGPGRGAETVRGALPLGRVQGPSTPSRWGQMMTRKDLPTLPTGAASLTRHPRQLHSRRLSSSAAQHWECGGVGVGILLKPKVNYFSNSQLHALCISCYLGGNCRQVCKSTRNAQPVPLAPRALWAAGACGGWASRASENRRASRARLSRCVLGG